MLFFGDCVVLKSDPRVIGFVDRTFHELDSHSEPLYSAYPAGVYIDDWLALPEVRSSFLSQGIPPRGWIVISWPFGREEGDSKHALLPEWALDVVDRELDAGQIVKRDPGDSVSGVVTQYIAHVDLLPPSPWPWPFPNAVGHGILHDKPKLCDVPTQELVRPTIFAEDQFVILNDWFGQIRDAWPDITIQLSNGSVVTLEDSEDVNWSQSEDITPSVGDFIQTKKGNIRRGKWIFGAFDPNEEPCGYVLDVNTAYVQVEWLCQRYKNTGTPEPTPPSELDREILENGDLRLYDAGDAHRAVQGDLTKTSLGSLKVQAGDKVCFKDPLDANLRYKRNMKVPPNGESPSVNEFIPRHKTLGYDLNVFTVVNVRTEIRVLWQDLSESQGRAIDFVPSLDLDDDLDNVWGGDLVITRETSHTADSTYVPSNFGIVQSVNSRDRIAQVRWFSGSVSFADPDSSILLPGSYTGKLQQEVETVSLYDITTPSLARSVGDLVTFVPAPEAHRSEESIGGEREEQYALVQRILDSPSENRDWVGEVVGLGLDGLLTIRLGASRHIREVRVPWECTYIAYGVNDDESDDDEPGGSDDTHGEIETDSVEEHYREMWFDESGYGISDEQDAGWTTEEDEDEDQNEDDETEEDYTTADEDEDVVMAENPVTSPSLVDPATTSFSYATMFCSRSATGDTLSRPVAFEILEELPPDDHHFLNRPISRLDGQRMRRIQKEHRILEASLPEGVWIRTWETAMDLMRVLILGPLDTPYEYAPFVIDLYLDSSFPTRPPKAFFHSWTQGGGPINPNFYEDGTICLSLLGTWPGDVKNDNWTPKSTILQVVVSLLGLVLVKEPFYNEAGYDVRQGTQETQTSSALYSERTYIKSHNFIVHALNNPVKGFDQIIHTLYLVNDRRGPMLLIRAICNALQALRRRQPCVRGRGEQTGRALSTGALVPLRRHVEVMIGLVNKHDVESGQSLQKVLNEPTAQLRGGPFGIFDELSAS